MEFRSGNREPKAYTLPQLKTIMESWQTGLMRLMEQFILGKSRLSKSNLKIWK